LRRAPQARLASEKKESIIVIQHCHVEHFRAIHRLLAIDSDALTY
jgi:hypothetical protein